MYVDAHYDRKNEIVHVVERVDGNRVLVTHRPDWSFYVQDPQGKQRSIYGEPVSLVNCKSSKDFRKNMAIHRGTKTYESDIKPEFKILSKHYNGTDTPRLHTAFFDIEVDFDPERGYSSTEEAFMPITAIGVYLQWLETMVCFAVPPRTLTWEQAQNIAKDYPEVVLCRDEKQMLDQFLSVIEDADILSGWNSEGYDIPYTVNRIIKVMGKSETRRLCLWDQMPRHKEYESHGKIQNTYTLSGRVHLDYMQLYINYNYEERHSYRLDYIGEMEVGEKKVAYEGSLDKLYKHDFALFLEYNIQDVMLLEKLDRKLQFIDLANTIAHDNTVLLPTVSGAVATTEQAIINEAHRRGFVVPDKQHGERDGHAAGAYVANPVKGYHEWIGSMDINSLYPSVIRALNMGPETIVGQLRLEHTDAEIRRKMSEKRSFADSWNNKFASNEYEYMINRDTNVKLHLDLETGESVEVTGADVYNLIFNSDQHWNISANGTIFKTADEFQGIIPGLLERWYAERKELQAKKKQAQTPAEIAFWDKRQLVKKINLNSLYGAILNPHCRFFDKRIGQSTTLTGRMITRHMAAETNRMLTGEYDHQGETIIYGDSVTGDSIINLSDGTEIAIEDLYNRIPNKIIHESGKEYAIPRDEKEQERVLGYNSMDDIAKFGSINYVMRHKTKKKLYKITTESGKTITVTEDHSLIVDRHGFTEEIAPADLKGDDLLITFVNSDK